MKGSKEKEEEGKVMEMWREWIEKKEYEDIERIGEKIEEKKDFERKVRDMIE